MEWYSGLQYSYAYFRLQEVVIAKPIFIIVIIHVHVS